MIRLHLLRALVAVLLAVGFGFLALRIQVTDDLRRVLPRDGELPQALEFVQRFRVADTLMVEVDGTGSDRATLLAEVDALGARLAADPAIARVRYRVDVKEGMELMKAVRPLGVDLVPADRLAERLTEPGIEAALRGWLVKLSGPTGGAMERLFTEDPLDLSGLALENLRASSQSFRFQTASAHYLDATGTRALLFVEPVQKTMEMGPDAPLLATLEEHFSTAGLPVRWFGGHRLAATAARTIRDDLALASTLGTALVLLLSVLLFRSIRPSAGLLPVLLPGAAATLGVAGLLSPLHGASLGIASAYMGIADDYWIHLYTTAVSRKPGPRFVDRLRAGDAALRTIAPDMAVASMATIGACLILTTSRYTLVQHFGMLGAASILGTVVGVVLIGPLVFAVVGVGGVKGELRALPPRWTRYAVLGATVLAVLFAGRLEIDGDPQHLIAYPEEVREVERAFNDRYGGFGTGGMVVMEAPDLGAALDASNRMEAALSALPAVSTVQVSNLLPGPALVAERRAAVPPTDVLQARIDAAAARVGFAPEALAGAAARVTAGFARPVDGVDPAAWDDTPLATLAGQAVEKAPDRVTSMLAVVVGEEASIDAVEAAVEATNPTARLLLPARFAAEGVTDILGEILRLGSMAMGGVLLLLAVRYRSLRRTFAAFLPVATAVCWAVGVLAVLQVPWNVVTMAGMVLIFGLSVDYGVYMLEGSGRGDEATSGLAVTSSALTTIASFVALSFARSPALSGLGLTVLAGMTGSLVASLVLAPILASGQPLLGPGVRRWVGRLGWAAVVAVNLDLLLLLSASLRPPTVDAPATADERTEPHPGDRRLGPNRLLASGGLLTAYLQGSPYARGWASGTLAADLQARLEAETDEAFTTHVPSALARFAILRGTMLLAPRLDRYIRPEDLLEIRGAVDAAPSGSIARGTDFTRRVYYHAVHDIGQALVDTPFVAACTGFLAGPPATTGSWILARNFDFDGGVAFDRDKVVHFVVPDEGIPFVSVSFANMVGVVSGMNAEGIALALQAAGSDDPLHLGTPMTLVAREALERAGSLDEVEAILERRRGFVNENVLALDAQAGEAVVFEVTPTRVVRLPAADGVLGVSNHFRTAELSQHETTRTRLAEQTTGPRLARMEELLARHRGTVDADVALDILGDRAGLHDVPLPPGHRHALDADIATHSVVFDATARTVRVSRYPNVAGGYVEYDLDRALAGDITPREVRPRGNVARTLAVHEGRRLLWEARSQEGAEAEVTARRALDRLPGHPEALLTLARALVAQGRGAEALPLLDQALAAPPETGAQARSIQALRDEVAP